MELPFGPLALVADLSGALFWPEERVLMIADLHFEKGSTLARRGVYLPPYDTRATLAQLSQVISHYQPAQVIFLGDSFHDGEALARIDSDDLTLLKALVEAQETVWITGNHDPEIPAELGGLRCEERHLGPVVLRHMAGEIDDQRFEISGHFHPAAALSQRGRVIRCKCFISDGRRLILPAFGAFTGGFSISAAPFQPLFDWVQTHAWLLGERAIYKFPARRLR